MEGQTVTDRAAKKGWITAKEAARRSGFSLPTIYRWCDNAEVESERVAKKRFVKLSTLKKKVGGLGKELLED